MMFNLRADGTPGWTYATNVAKLRLEETQVSVVQVETAEMVNGANVNNVTLGFARDGCKIIIGVHISHRNAYKALVRVYPHTPISRRLFGPKRDRGLGTCWPVSQWRDRSCG